MGRPWGFGFFALPAALCLGCGDSFLTEEFTGPPASAVSGNLVDPSSQGDPGRPRLSLEWLANSATTGEQSLLGQLAAFGRSDKLDRHWDIDLFIPVDDARFNLDVGTETARIGVSKMVYFDDRTADDRLEWACGSQDCDRVTAVSTEFVLFVDTPPFCLREGRRTVPRTHSGYHFYSFEDGVLRKLGPDEPLSFTVPEGSVNRADINADLHAFVTALQRAWATSALDGC